MPTSSFADQSDPDLNRWFRRRWAAVPPTPRELQHAADLELAHGNARRADLLSWAAHQRRSGAEVGR
jgi:hypothetical protein